MANYQIREGNNVFPPVPRTLSLPSDATKEILGQGSYHVLPQDTYLLVLPLDSGTAIHLYPPAAHDVKGREITIQNTGTLRQQIITVTADGVYPDGGAPGTINGQNLFFIEPTQSVSFRSDGEQSWWTVSTDDLTHQITLPPASGALSVNWQNGKNQVVLVTGATTISLSGGAPGGHYTLVCWQDGAGGHELTWPGDVAFSGNVRPTPTYDPGSVDVFAFYYDGETYIMAGSLYTSIG